MRKGLSAHMQEIKTGKEKHMSTNHPQFFRKNLKHSSGLPFPEKFFHRIFSEITFKASKSYEKVTFLNHLLKN